MRSWYRRSGLWRGLCLAVSALLLLAAPALGAKTAVKSIGAASAGGTGGLFSAPRGVAVNQNGIGAAAGTFYVIDSANNRVQQFNPAGEFVRTWGWGVRDGEAEFQTCKTAATCQAGTAGPGAGSLRAPQGIALDQTTGNLYVSDQGNRRVDVFGPNGAFQGAFGYGVRTGAAEFQFCTTSCVDPNTAAGAQGGRFGAAMGGLAVDPVSGNLYVASKTNRRVEVFKPIVTSGVVSNAEFLRAFGWDVLTGGVTTFEVCEVAASCKQGTGGANPGQFATLNSPSDIAIDSAGSIYAVDLGNKRVQKFSPVPALIAEKFGSTALSSEAFGTGEILNVAIDPSSAPNRVLVSGRRSTSGNQVAVLETDSSGNKLYLHGEELTPSGTGIGTNPASTGIAVAKATLGGNLYLTTPTTNILQGVYILNEGPSIEAVSAIGAHEATLHGQLVSNDANVRYHFEYMAPGGSWTKLPATDADAGTSSAAATIASTGTGTGTLAIKARGGTFTLNFNSETTTPLAYDAAASAVQAALEALPSIGAGNVTVSGGPGSADGSTPYAISLAGALAGTEVTEISAFAGNLLAPTIAVSQVATGLHGNTKYAVRLVATRPASGLPITTAQVNFTTLPAAPAVSAPVASVISDSSATLEGDINPENQSTSYQFEYLTQADYEANGNNFTGPNTAAKIPSTPLDIGSGINDVSVSEHPTHLTPSTVYRFRLLATTNTNGSTLTTLSPEATFTTYAPPQVFPSCPNDSWRTGPSASLPDCRAYEQASPVDKNGGSIQANAPSVRAADGGSAITFESVTGVPGGSGSQNFPTYLAMRGSGNWSSIGLLPDARSGQRGRVLGWTPGFDTVFDLAEKFGGGVSMLARSTTSGNQAELTPYTLPNPEYSYVDSSDNREVTIFEAGPTGNSVNSLKLTDPAAEGEPNVYAWDRDAPEGERLHLAGILPDGTTPARGSRVNAGIGAQAYNRDSGAVTSDGSVFFNSDDAEGQLYLRLNPTEGETDKFETDEFGNKTNCIPDPVLACTVHISASQKTNGGGLEDHDAAGPRPADLKAASPDGSVVTFTSSEKLTNDANTGPEPAAPAIARAKVSDPNDKDLDFIPVFAHEIAVDEVEEYVYWSDPANGRIGRAKLDGTDVDDSYITGLNEPLGVAVVDDPSVKFIFWTERGPVDESGKPLPDEEGKPQGTIGRADLDGTNVNQSCFQELENPRSIVANSEFVYWTSPEFISNVGTGDLGRATVACEGAEVGAKEPEFIKNTTTVSGDVTVNASHIYTSSFSSQGKVSRINSFTLAGVQDGFGIVQVTNTNSAVGLSVDGSHLYWTDPDHNNIGRADLDGANPVPAFISGAAHPEDAAIAGEDLLWTANQEVVPNPGTDLYQLDRESGKLTDLAPDSVHPFGIEVQGVLGASENGSYVYFAANGVPDNLEQSTNDNGESAVAGDCKGITGISASGVCNLYVAHGEKVDFIARLSAAQLIGSGDSGDAINWIPDRKEMLTATGRSARVSADGRVLVFRSSRKLTDYDNQGPRCLSELGSTEGKFVPGSCLEFYRFDVEDMDIVCLTCNPRGVIPEGPAYLESTEPPNLGAPPTAGTLGRNLSRDGSRFFFETPDALVTGDTNGLAGCPHWGSAKQRARACQDVYEWEAPGSGSCSESSPAYSSLNMGCIYLISTGKSKEASFFADADLKGDNVFIYTYEQLVPRDKDNLLDVYDARAGGGLAAQHAVEAEPCGEGDCTPVPSTPPAVQSPGSAGFSGPPDPKPQRVKKKHKKKRKHAKHRRRGKQGKARHGKGKQKRMAKRNGRAGR